jgi:hypothetical protein
LKIYTSIPPFWIAHESPQGLVFRKGPYGHQVSGMRGKIPILCTTAALLRNLALDFQRGFALLLLLGITETIHRKPVILTTFL